MLSGKLVSLIESNWEEIADRLIQAIRNHPDLPTLAKQPELENREWCQQILENLGYLLSAERDEEEIRRRYEVMGRLRFEESVPLSEAVLRAQVLREKILGFTRERMPAENIIQLYAEEELERRVVRFFDNLIYQVVRGYESAMRQMLRIAQTGIPRSRNHKAARGARL